MEPTKLKVLIKTVFESVPWPGSGKLCDCSGGPEPSWVEEEFAEMDDWRALSPQFLDHAPRGLGTALGFFSDAALRFYLPAYLCADLDGQLSLVQPDIRLCEGLDDANKEQTICRAKFGARTWYDYYHFRYSTFTRSEVCAIRDYLMIKREWMRSVGETTSTVDEALRNYWMPRCASGFREAGPDT